MNREQEAAAIAALERKYRHQLEKGPHWRGISVRAGWIPIVESLLERTERELTPFERRRVRWAQIKSKWAQLRAYYHIDGGLSRLHVDIATPEGPMHLVSGVDDPLSLKMDALVAQAAGEAAKLCEICGAQGRVVNAGGWLLVACPAHGGGRTAR